MTDEQRKALKEYLGEPYATSEYTVANNGDLVSVRTVIGEHSFTTDADMMALFRKMVDYLNFGAFQNFAYKYFNEYPNYTFTEWLFYDPSRFCRLVAQWLKEKK